MVSSRGKRNRHGTITTADCGRDVHSWSGGADAEPPDEGSFTNVAPRNHVGTHTLQPLRYENVITTLPDNYWAV